MSRADAAESIATAIRAWLKADPDIAGRTGGRIYDVPPAAADFPYVSTGPSDTRDDSAEGIDGLEVTVTLDLWSRDAGRLGPVRRLADAVAAALEGAELAVAGAAVAGVEIEGVRAFRDPDGVTGHGVVPVTVLLEF